MNDLAYAVELYAAIQCSVIGLSHIFQPKAWADFFIRLRSWGLPGVFANAFIVLGFGTIIVSFHNVWHGWPTVLTVLGWSQVLKGATSFVIPQLGMRGLNRISLERSWMFVVAGVFFLALSGVFWYIVLTH